MREHAVPDSHAKPEFPFRRGFNRAQTRFIAVQVTAVACEGDEAPHALRLNPTFEYRSLPVTARPGVPDTLGSKI